MPIDAAELPALVTEGQLIDKLGIEITSQTLDEVTARMPVAGNLQPFGVLHGGANAVLAETLGSVLAALHALPERFPVGLQLNCTHLGSVTSGWVTGVARPVHIGRSTATIEIVITDDTGRTTCTAQLICLNRDTRPAI